MTLTPLTDAPLAIQIHLGLAVLAVLIGPIALYRPRRDWLHKVTGRCWIVLMAGVAISAFPIDAAVGPNLFGFGFIHGLSVVVLVSLWRGLRAAMARDITVHSAIMRSLYWQSLGIAGLFTFLPGRRLNAVLFGDRPELGWVVIALGALLLGAGALKARKRPSPLAARAN